MSIDLNFQESWWEILYFREGNVDIVLSSYDKFSRKVKVRFNVQTTTRVDLMKNLIEPEIHSIFMLTPEKVLRKKEENLFFNPLKSIANQDDKQQRLNG
jgi:hypothetical protein